MGISIAGMAAAYQGAQQELRRIEDDKRRAEAAEAAKRDEEFREQTRDRQRAEWSEADRIRAEDRADREAVAKEFDQRAAEQAATEVADIATPEIALPQVKAAPGKAPAAPAKGGKAAKAQPQAGVAITPADLPALVAPAAQIPTLSRSGGVPAPQNFNDSLDRQIELTRRKMARGTLTPEEYAARTGALNRMRQEGVHEALTLMGQGRYDEAMARYNSVGNMRGAKILKAEEGTTKINGEEMPTRFVTIRNPDGSRTTMDVTKAQYQLLDFNTQLSHADRARTAKENRENIKFQQGMTEKEFNARRAAEQRSYNLQLEAARRERENTPSGKLAAIEKALGRTLTAEERAKQLGFDTMPAATRAQLNSLLKQQDQISAAMNKAQAEGMWDPNAPGSRELMTRDAELSLRVAQLLSAGTGKAAPADPGGIFEAPAPAASTVPAQASPAPAAAPAPRAAPAQNPGARQPAAPPVSFANAKSAPPRAAFAQVGGVRPSGPPRSVSQILASSDPAYQRLMAPKAAAIEAAAAEFRAANAEYVQVARGGDPNANAAFLPRVQKARAALELALDEAGASNNPEVLRAVGMQ